MMAKQHIKRDDGKALCGIETKRFKDKELATCSDCRKRAGLEVIDKSRDSEPDWNRKCMNCGAKPVVPFSGMCGPCTFGEGDTAGGNW